MAEIVCRVCKQMFRGLTGREKTCPDCKRENSLASKCRREEKIKARIAARRRKIRKLQAEIKELRGSL